MCCKKKILIGWSEELWNMRWRASDQEVDQRGRGERFFKKIAKHAIWTGRMLWIVVDGKKLIKTGWWSGWWAGECFFLVLAHPGSPRQRAIKWLLLLLLLTENRIISSPCFVEAITHNMFIWSSFRSYDYAIQQPHIIHRSTTNDLYNISMQYQMNYKRLSCV